MNRTLYKILTLVALPIVIATMCFFIIRGVMKPVKFERERVSREAVAIQRLKDLRTIQTAFKSEVGHYASTFDSLKMFYNSGTITVDLQIGSMDDSLAVENTKALRKKNPKISSAELLQRAQAGERLVFNIPTKLAVKDTLFHNREGFVIDSIFVIPFCGKSVQMQTIIKTVSGVQVPLFEACMPYRDLLKGMDNQLRINLDADRQASNRYEGLMVGSISVPNNNAGNWE